MKVISSKGNELIKHIKKLKDKKYREKYKKPLCCTKNRRHNGFFGIQ